MRFLVAVILVWSSPALAQMTVDGMNKALESKDMEVGFVHPMYEVTIGETQEVFETRKEARTYIDDNWDIIKESDSSVEPGIYWGPIDEATLSPQYWGCMTKLVSERTDVGITDYTLWGYFSKIRFELVNTKGESIDHEDGYLAENLDDVLVVRGFLSHTDEVRCPDFHNKEFEKHLNVVVKEAFEGWYERVGPAGSMAVAQHRIFKELGHPLGKQKIAINQAPSKKVGEKAGGEFVDPPSVLVAD